jgi:hypothetical protein
VSDIEPITAKLQQLWTDLQAENAALRTERDQARADSTWCADKGMIEAQDQRDAEIIKVEALRAVLREYADTYTSKIFMCKDLEDRARALLGEK